MFGDKSADTTVVLFGDSHAMHWSPALNDVARERGWKLLVLTKGGCHPASVTTWIGKLKRDFFECVTWRKDAIRQIDELEPDMVMMSGLAGYRVWEGDSRLSREASDAKLEAGYVKTLHRLESTGAELVVVRDVPHPDRKIPDCVSENMHALERCAIDKDEGLDYAPVGVRAAERFQDVRLVDPTPKLCKGGTCPAVVGNVLVYRSASHLTATYVKTLDDWLGHQLPSPL